MLSWLLVAALLGPPPVAEVALQGAVGDVRALRLLVDDLLGKPLDEGRLRAVVQALGARDETGGVDVSQALTRDGVRLVFHFTRPRTWLDRYGISVDGDAQAGMELARMLDVNGLRSLVVGQPWHPYLGRADRDAVRGWFQDRGHLDVAVSAVVEQAGELTRLHLAVQPGPKCTLGTWEVVGLPEGAVLDLALPGLAPGVPARRQGLHQAAAALRDWLCAEGYPEARVATDWEVVGDRAAVRFAVTPGSRVVVAARLVEGIDLPPAALADLAPGRPWCPATADRVAAEASAWLKQDGVVDPVVEIQARQGPLGASVRVASRLRAAARLNRIWFEGNVDTHVRILRQLVTLKEGDAPTPDAIERSLQNLRRSGLFRQADARLLPAGDGTGYYLWFRVREWELITVSAGQRAVTLRNLNVLRVPRSLDEGLSAWRGEGQQLEIRTDSAWRQLVLTDPFLGEDLFGRVTVERRSFQWGFVGERTDSARLALGFRGMQNRLLVVPELSLTRTAYSAPPDHAALPLRDDDRLDLTLGLETRLDLSAFDNERIAYQGFDGGLSLLTGLVPAPDDDRPWLRSSLRLRGSLPLWRNAEGQHFVARLTAEGAGLLSPGRSRGWQRVTYGLRGYTSTVMRQAFALPDGGEALIGGEHAWRLAAEVRVPLPWRRHAITTFFEAGHAGGFDLVPWETLWPAAGLNYFFSLLGERVEGYVQASLGLREEGPANVLEAGGGGSF